MREFRSIEAFVSYMRGAPARIDEAVHRGLEVGAGIIQKEAKGELGRYQEGVRPFVGWAELADRTKDERVAQGYSENDPGLREGDMRDSIEKTVERREASIGSNDANLEYFEMGTVRQPPRSVLGLAAVRNTDEVVDAIGSRVAAALAGKPIR